MHKHITINRPIPRANVWVRGVTTNPDGLPHHYGPWIVIGGGPWTWPDAFAVARNARGPGIQIRLIRAGRCPR